MDKVSVSEQVVVPARSPFSPGPASVKTDCTRLGSSQIRLRTGPELTTVTWPTTSSSGMMPGSSARVSGAPAQRDAAIATATGIFHLM